MPAFSCFHVRFEFHLLSVQGNGDVRSCRRQQSDISRCRANLLCRVTGNTCSGLAALDKFRASDLSPTGLRRSVMRDPVEKKTSGCVQENIFLFRTVKISVTENGRKVMSVISVNVNCHRPFFKSRYKASGRSQ